MSVVRVVARVRPLLKSEREEDVIVYSDSKDGASEASQSLLKIPNAKNPAEEYSFQFNSVYGQDSTQQEIFDAEVTPTVKHLFLGYDVTIFAYGSTGTGKTHTMRGGKTLADRGMIPRLLSAIYRKSRALEKNSNGQTAVEVSMSYYEIYNDRVFDLFESPDKRTATGLPIREAEGGKTVVCGLSEVPCGTLKDFEGLYDKANSNRSTGATKLNAHSSRSHAILCVKVTITTPTDTRVSTASAIDLAGSEDNRRTGNGKDRMVESASINKSLFVLAQCVEAISKKQQRIPYRESKMTRILSLGQNNGFTVMILNLAPVKSYHLDTLSSLNFANRTKKIEVREVENDPIFKGPPRQPAGGMTSLSGPTLQRQPLRPLANGINLNLTGQREAAASKTNGKLLKAFSVYSDTRKPRISNPPKSSPAKRHADPTFLPSSRPQKTFRPTPSSSFLHRGPPPSTQTLTKAAIESVVEQKVTEILAARAMNAPDVPPTKGISDEVQKRLDSIEQRLAGQEGERAEGLSFLLMAKQHQARGENMSALKMYELARPYFPDNEKLEGKIVRLREKVQEQFQPMVEQVKVAVQKLGGHDESGARDDESYYEDGPAEEEDDYEEDEESFRTCPKKPQRSSTRRVRISSPDPLNGNKTETEAPSPRTRHLLHIINTRDVSQMKLLSGLGAKRAEGIVEGLREWDGMYGGGERWEVTSWRQLGKLRGIGKRTLESMRVGVSV